MDGGDKAGTGGSGYCGMMYSSLLTLPPFWSPAWAGIGGGSGGAWRNFIAPTVDRKHSIDVAIATVK